MSEPVQIGPERQLFLDGHVIEWLDKVERRVCPLEKSPKNPVIRPEAPWEPAGYLTYGSVLFDNEEQLYKAWCSGTGAPRVPADRQGAVKGGCFYFTSADGICWERPELGLFDVAGHPTNIVALGQHASHERRWPEMYEVFGVSKDAPERDSARRYKMGWLYLIFNYDGPDHDPNHPTQKRGLGVAFSPDGIHWTPSEDAVTRATSDGGTYWYRDEATGRYVMYGRGRRWQPDVLARYGEGRFFQQQNSGRAVRRSESDDFVHWTPNTGELMFSTDALDGPADEVYSLAVFPYEGIYIGLVQMFHNEPERVWLDIQLAVSRDGVHFQRLTDRTPFIPCGGIGAWDRFNNSMANNPPVRVADELRFYYSGRNFLHSGACKGPDNGGHAGLPFVAGVGCGTIKVDRFAALEASFDAGTVRTKPLLYDGQRLHVNADVKFGRLEVALLDADGNEIEGSHANVQGQDGTDIAVPLNGLGPHAGQPVRLEFTIHNGRLYSFRVN